MSDPEVVSASPTPTPAEATGKEGARRMVNDPRPHLNLVFIGHVDAGKSTTCGNILCLSGQVDERLLQKFEREAKDKNRGSWYLAYIMDTNEEERERGKTVEVGRAQFSTTERRFTILDAPGHRGFIPNMIAGASQADVAVLIISARKGEFEAGFERSGQTREHVVLAKTLGVSHLIIAINKMDEPTMNWDIERFEDIKKKMHAYVRTVGFNPAETPILPVSSLSGQNLRDHVSDPNSPCFDARASWYPTSEPTLFQLLNTLPLPPRAASPFRMTLLDGYKDQGIVAMGKIESGKVAHNDSVLLMPGKIQCKVQSVSMNEGEAEIEYNEAPAGENVLVRLLNIEEEQIDKGMVLCSVDKPCPVVTGFKATAMIVDLEPGALISAGFRCVMHIHTAIVDIEIRRIHKTTDRATKKSKENPPFALNNQMAVCSIQVLNTHGVCMETYANSPQLGRFTLRDKDKTIAIGKVDEIMRVIE